MLVSSRVRGWSRVAAGLAAVAMASSLAVASPAAAPKSVPAKLDINLATKQALANLPEIGEEYAQKIIDGRPYKTTAELESRKILPKSVYEKIAPLVIVRPK